MSSYVTVDAEVRVHDVLEYAKTADLLDALVGRNDISANLHAAIKQQIGFPQEGGHRSEHDWTPEGAVADIRTALYAGNRERVELVLRAIERGEVFA